MSVFDPLYPSARENPMVNLDEVRRVVAVMRELGIVDLAQGGLTLRLGAAPVVIPIKAPSDPDAKPEDPHVKRALEVLFASSSMKPPGVRR